jgi:hypothetical protein
LYRDGVFVILKSTYFQKILCKNANTKTKILMDLQRIYTQKNQLVYKRKIQYGAENQDGCEFRIFVKILLPHHGLCLNL